MIIQIDGADALSRLLRAMPTKAMSVAKKRLKIITMDLMSKAQEITPVETGDLQGSAFNEVTQMGANTTGTVGFTEPYATRQHENLGYHHLSPGQAKYLEQPYMENEAKYVKSLGDEIAAAVRRKI